MSTGATGWTEESALIYQLGLGACQIYKFIDHRNRHRRNRFYLSISPGKSISIRRVYLGETCDVCASPRGCDRREEDLATHDRRISLPPPPLGRPSSVRDVIIINAGSRNKPKRTSLPETRPANSSPRYHETTNLIVETAFPPTTATRHPRAGHVLTIAGQSSPIVSPVSH